MIRYRMSWLTFILNKNISLYKIILMRTGICCLLVMIFFASAFAQPEKGRVKKPNIIYILADDMGYGDVKTLNPGSKIPTPHMDQIIAQGVHFTDAHSGSSVCTPTRYGILTGRYAWRTTLKQGVLWGYSPPLIESGRETVATLLKKAGYETACIGKWHLGLTWAKKDPTKEVMQIVSNTPVTIETDDNVDYSKPVAGGPSGLGFDYSFIIPASLDMSPYCYLRNGRVTDPSMSFTAGKDQEKDGRGVFWRAGKMATGFDFNKVLLNFVDSAVYYIKLHAKKTTPFFLYLALPSLHTPWLPTGNYNGKSGAGKYGDYVFMTDAMIGSIIQAVKQQNLEENTLLIVVSDNGSEFRPADIESTGHYANYIFKGRKADIYEGGHRVPFMAYWKGVIPAGTTSDEVMCTTDLMATVAGLLNIPLPKNAAEDSYNLWPAFFGQTSSSPIREATIHHSEKGFFSIRKGKWKYAPQPGSGGYTKPVTISPKAGEPMGTLYDLEKDPKEENNLYEKYSAVVKELDDLLKDLIKKGHSRKM